MSDLVSIGVCAYNAEKTIFDALLSVFKQTYRPLELIIVNDCSTDNTLEIVNKFKLNYEYNDFRVVVVSLEKNGRIANARNTAVSSAKGKWFGFLDSDDTYLPEFISTMVNALNRNDADLAVCDFYSCKGEDKTYCEGINSNYDTKYLEAYLLGYPNPWNKMYSMELLRKINPLFKDYLYEDFSLMDRLFTHSMHPIYVNKAMINYNLGNGISQSIDKRLLQMITILKERYVNLQYHKDRFDDFEIFALNDCVPRIFDQLIAILLLDDKSLIYGYYGECIEFLNSNFGKKWKKNHYFKPNSLVLKLVRNSLKFKLFICLYANSSLIKKYIRKNYRL